MNNLYENLKKKLITLQNSRKDFLNIKTQKIKLINISNQKTNEIKIKNLLSDELTEIDQQIESLTSIIETSKNIGNLIINPVSEKEIILKNVEDVIQVLETQNELKKIIKELDIEINIEKKIEIILKARELLNKNGNILNDYNEEIIKKSKDVLSYLDTNYNSYKEKIMKTYDNEDKIKDKEELKEKEKEIKDNIKEMEKNSTLIYTLSNQKEYLINFFRFLGEHIQQSLCSINFIESVDNQIKKLKMINDSNNINTNKNDEIKEDIIKLSNILKSKLQKIFLKISHFIQERQKKCIILDSNNINKEGENNNEFSLLYQLLNILINSLEPYLIKMIKYLIVLIEIMEKYNEIFSHDFICVESSFITT